MRKPRYSFFMPAEDHGFIKRGVVYNRMWFTDHGRILSVMGFISLMVSSPGLQIAAYFMPSFILTLFATAFVFAFLSRPRLQVRRILPSPACAGEFCVYQVVVTNAGRFPIRDLTVSEGVLPYGIYDKPDHPDFRNTIPWLEPSESVTLNLVIRCKRRGIYSLSRLLAGTSFPSGLFRWPVQTGSSDRFIVYPHFVSQTDFLIPYKRVYQPGGIAVSSQVGDSTEFLTTREYRRGDRLRDIHWPSSARTGRLIVKEYVDEYFVRIGLLLDTELPEGRKPELFEERVSLAAGIADAVARKDYIIDLFSAGESLHHFQMGRALAHLENLLELLACIDGVRHVNMDKVEAGLDPYLRQLSCMVILLGDWDQKRARLCEMIERRGTAVRVIVLREQPLTEKPDRDLTLINGEVRETMVR